MMIRRFIAICVAPCTMFVIAGCAGTGSYSGAGVVPQPNNGTAQIANNCPGKLTGASGLQVSTTDLGTITSVGATASFTACTRYFSTYTISVSPAGVVSLPSSPVTPTKPAGDAPWSALITAKAVASGTATITVMDKKGMIKTVKVTVTLGPSQIYYTYLNTSVPGPQLAIVSYPLTTTSVPTTITGSATNMLGTSTGLLFDASGRLWVFNQAPPCCINNVIQVFSLPVTQTSSPVFTLTLNGVGMGTNFVGNGAFDSAGNLWAVSGPLVYEYRGPFNSTATISPALTLGQGGFSLPLALAFDAKGDLFVTNLASTGTNSVSRYDAPITNGMTASAQFNGISSPGGLAFDTAGNLYVAGFVGPFPGPGAIFRYSNVNQANGATPDIVDPNSNSLFFTQATLAFDGVGNLYEASCSVNPTIFEFPTATTAFSSSLAPSVVFSQSVTNIHCVWGLVIR